MSQLEIQIQQLRESLQEAKQMQRSLDAIRIMLDSILAQRMGVQVLEPCNGHYGELTQ